MEKTDLDLVYSCCCLLAQVLLNAPLELRMREMSTKATIHRRASVAKFKTRNSIDRLSSVDEMSVQDGANSADEDDLDTEDEDVGTKSINLSNPSETLKSPVARSLQRRNSLFKSKDWAVGADGNMKCVGCALSSAFPCSLWFFVLGFGASLPPACTLTLVLVLLGSNTCAALVLLGSNTCAALVLLGSNACAALVLLGSNACAALVLNNVSPLGSVHRGVCCRRVIQSDPSVEPNLDLDTTVDPDVPIPKISAATYSDSSLSTTDGGSPHKRIVRFALIQRGIACHPYHVTLYQKK